MLEAKTARFGLTAQVSTRLRELRHSKQLDLTLSSPSLCFLIGILETSPLPPPFTFNSDIGFARRLHSL